MEIGFESQRVAILIDEANIHITCKNLYSSPINYQSIMEKLNHRQIVRAIVYLVDSPEVDKSAFIRKLSFLNYEVKTKAVKCYANGKRKADWDVGITIDAVSLAEKVDVITLVTGDGDYEPLVHYLKSKGVKVEVMGFPLMTSRDLINAVDKFIPITEDLILKVQHLETRNNRPPVTS
ncbi:MAG: NYN domain-containing protein [Deltaproteobacteria bacterium]|nr:NYN domain-containing protein [Deltaproteobacteria bacterium]